MGTVRPLKWSMGRIDVTLVGGMPVSGAVVRLDQLQSMHVVGTASASGSGTGTGTATAAVACYCSWHHTCTGRTVSRACSWGERARFSPSWA